MNEAKDILMRSAMLRCLRQLVLMLALFLPFSTLSAIETDAEGYMLIGTAEEFVQFATKVNDEIGKGGKTDFAYKVRLANNIDMSAIDTLRPIGMAYGVVTTKINKVSGKPITTYYEGVGKNRRLSLDFDGAGHKISNVTIRGMRIDTIITKSRTIGLGLFNMLSNSSVIRDLTIENIDFEFNLQTHFEKNSGRTPFAIGGLAGVLNGGTVSNVSISGVITVGGDSEGVCVELGGMFGHVGGIGGVRGESAIKVENVRADVHLKNYITSEETLEKRNLKPANGGVIGALFAFQQVENATIVLNNVANGRDGRFTYSDTEVQFRTNTGGVIGYMNLKAEGAEYRNISFAGLNNYGVVGGYDVLVSGGVIGTIADCDGCGKQRLSGLYNNGEVYGLTAGGVVGVCDSTNLFGCVNLGNVSFLDYYADQANRPNVNLGGIVGRFQPFDVDESKADNLTGCVNAGNVGVGVKTLTKKDNISSFIGVFEKKNLVRNAGDVQFRKYLLSNNLNLSTQSERSSFPFGGLEILVDTFENSIDHKFSRENCSKALWGLDEIEDENERDSLRTVFESRCTIWRDSLVNDDIVRYKKELNIMSPGVYTDSTLYNPADSNINVYAADSGRAVKLGIGDLTSVSMREKLYSDVVAGVECDKQFVFSEGCYPLVATGKDNDIARLAASPVFLPKGERWDSISSVFEVCVALGAEWSSENGLLSYSESGGKGYMSVKKGGDDVLIGRIGEAEKRINVRVYKTLFGGGKGTEDDPYLLRNPEQLAELNDSINESSNGMKDVYFKIANDIDKVDFVLAENADKPFKGILDGDNHTVILDVEKTGAAGLIANAEEATIKNIHVGGTVTGGTVAGGVVGDAVSCTVDKCYNTARVTAPIAGGIIGRAKGNGNVLTNYCNAGSITGSVYVGGLIGEFDGKGTLNIFANGGFVRGENADTYVGGVMGKAVTSGGIRCNDSYNYGSVYVHADRDIGASTGIGDWDKVTVDYFSPTFLFDNQIRDNGHCNVNNTYKVCKSLLSERVDVYNGYEQLVLEDGGYSFPVPTWLSEMNDAILMQAPLRIADNVFAKNILSEPSLPDASLNYDASVFGDDDWKPTVMECRAVDGKSAVVVRISAPSGEYKEVYLELEKNFFGQTGDPVCDGADGSKERPYCIYSAKEFETLSALIKGDEPYDYDHIGSDDTNWSKVKHFIVKADVSGVSKVVGTKDKKFFGDINGDGRTVELNISGGDNVGLFAATGDGAHIYNIVIDGRVEGQRYVGAVVGRADSNSDSVPVLRNVLNKANVRASGDYAGGLCGMSGAAISNCVNAGRVVGASNLGGIVGYSTCDIDSVLNLGLVAVSENVTNVKNIGGIAGTLNGEGATRSRLSTCMNSGMVDALDRSIMSVGGIVGSISNYDASECLNVSRVNAVSSGAGAICGEVVNMGDDFVNSYYDSQVSGVGKDASSSAKGMRTGELLNINANGDVLWHNTASLYPCFSETGIFADASQLATASVDLNVCDINAIYNGAILSIPNRDLKWDRAGENSFVDVLDETMFYQIAQLGVGSDTLVASYKGMSKQILVDIGCAPVFEDYFTNPSLLYDGCKPFVLRLPNGQDSIIYGPKETEIIITKNYPGTLSKVPFPHENFGMSDTVRTYKIIIRDEQNRTIPVVACNYYPLSGETITRDTVIAKNTDCGVDSYNIRIVKTKRDTVTLTDCDSVVHKGVVYHSNILLSDTIKSIECPTCDSFVHFTNIVVNKSYNIVEAIPAAIDSVQYGGKFYTEDTLLTVFTGVSVQNCDSVRKVQLRVLKSNTQRDTIDIYECGQYRDVKTNTTYDSDVELRDTVFTDEVNRKVTIRRVHVYKNTAKDTTYLPDVTGCDGRAYVTINGFSVEINKDSTIVTRVARPNKCDSIVYVKVKVYPKIIRDVKDTIVSCGPLYLPHLDRTLFANATINDTVKFADLKCDSLITTQPYLIVNTVENNVNAVDCEEARYVSLAGKEMTFTESCTFDDTLKIHQCPAKINHVNVSVANPVDFYFTKTSCEPVTLDGVEYDKTTIFHDTIKSVLGCDSLIRHVSIKIMDRIVKDSIVYACDSIIIHGELIKNDVPPIEVSAGLASNGVCDSFIRYRVNILHPVTDTLVHRSCGEYHFTFDNGSEEIFYNDTIFAEYLSSKLCDCDSTVFHKIIIGRADYVSRDTAQCYEIRFSPNDVMTESGVYTKVYKNRYGCDSIVTYNVTILLPTYNEIELVGETEVQFGDVVYKRSKTIDTVLANAAGCDSFLTVNIKIEADLGYPIIVNKFGYVLFCNNSIGADNYVSYQWYKNGEPIPGANKTFFEEAEGEKLKGCYKVVVHNEFGKEYVSETYCIDGERKLVVYPNPASPGETVYLQYDFTSEERRDLVVCVYSTKGNLVAKFVPTSFPIPVEGITQLGQYLIMIKFSDDTVLDGRFIVR